MTQLPWSLDFQPTTPGFSLGQHFDAATRQAEFTLVLNAARARTVGQVTLTAQLNLPAASGCVRLNSADSGGNDHAWDLSASIGEAPRARYRTPGRGLVRYRSEGWLALFCPARAFPAAVVGSLDRSRYRFTFELELDAEETVLRSLALAVDLEGERVAPGQEIPLSLFIAEGHNVELLAAEYASAVASDALGIDLPQSPSVIAPAAVEVSPGPADGIALVHPGLTGGPGDPLIEPTALKDEAARLRDAGRRPGLTLAPFLIVAGSAVLREHPEYAVSAAGQPRKLTEPHEAAVLDCSHPGARGWLQGIVRQAVEEWGFTCLDLRQLSSALVPRGLIQYHEPGFTALANLRAGLEAIRDAAGPGTFILAHDTPLGTASGLVDAVSAAPTATAVEDQAVAAAAQTALLRGLYNERWWLGAIDLPHSAGSLSDQAFRTALTEAALSGFIPILPPGFGDLAMARRSGVESILPATGVPAEQVPADEPGGLFAWRANASEGRFLVGVFNWSDAPRWVASEEYLRPGETAFDFWGARLLGKGDLLLQPWDASLWQVAADARGARLVGDAGNLTFASLYQRAVSGRLQLGNDLDRPRTVAVHARGSAFETTLQPGERRWFD